MTKLFKVSYFIIIISLVIFFTGCEVSVNNYVSEKALSDITTGNIEVLSSNFVISERVIETDNSEGIKSFISNLLNLKPDKECCHKAYATNKEGIGYENIMTFEILSTINDIDGNEYIQTIIPARETRTVKFYSNKEYENRIDNANKYYYLSLICIKD